VSSHERRTGTKVKLTIAGLPAQAELPVKITLYRIVQEALNNAFRHAEGQSRQLAPRLRQAGSRSKSRIKAQALTSTDPSIGAASGPGRHARTRGKPGGAFAVESKINHGTRVNVNLPLQP